MASLAARPLSGISRPSLSRSKTVGVTAVFRFFSRSYTSTQPLLLRTAATQVASPVKMVPSSAGVQQGTDKFTFHGVHHVALICADLERSLQFYQGLLGMEINPDRPDHKLPYRGAWLWIGPEMIHLMELPNPDPVDKQARPEHGGRDRHFCIGVANLDALAEKLQAAGITFTRSMSGRPAIFFRDPDMNCLECVELEPWR